MRCGHRARRQPQTIPYATTQDAFANFDLRVDYQEAHTARTVDPRSLCLALDAALPQKRNVVYDAGNFMGVVPYFKVPGPDHFKITTDFASIGIGFGTALGFAKARPDHTTVLVIGDGGFMMTLSELETVVREDLPIVIVMNDCAYGAELHVLRPRQLPVEKSLFPISTSLTWPRVLRSSPRLSVRWMTLPPSRRY